MGDSDGERIQLTPSDGSDGDHRRPCCTGVVFILAVAATALPISMTVVGVVHYRDCRDDSHIGLYMVIQGFISMMIPVLLGILYCVRYENVSAKITIGVLVVLGMFIVAWCGIGTYWLVTSNCEGTKLYSYAWAFSVPIWCIMFVLVLYYCMCGCRCCKCC